MKIGKVPENILKLSVLNQLHAKNGNVLSGAVVGADCAFFELSGQEILTVSTAEAAVASWKDSFEGHFFAMTMKQLIIKCVNNLAAGGAEPIAVQISLLLPGGTEMDDIRLMMREADDTCKEFNLQISGGQSRILHEVSVPIAVVNGYGSMCRDRYQSIKNAKPFQDIVLSKWVGLQGTAVLANWYKERLMKHYPAYLAENAKDFEKYFSVKREAEIAMQNGASAMHDASEGGIFAALWEFAEGYGVGLDIDLKKIPLKQETVEICECCGVNPYELMSGGCLIIAADDGNGLVRILKNHDIPAVVIGKTTDQKARIIRNEDEIRYMDRPKQDELFRISRGNAISFAIT